MATNFPGSADDAATVGGDSLPAAGTALSNSSSGHPSHSDLHENVGDAVQAVEAKVGTGSSAPAANTVLTGTGSGTSGWATVATAMIGDDQVTQAKIADDAVGADQLAASAVVTASIVDDNVTQAKIAAGAVGTTELGADAVTGAKIADDAVAAEHLATDSVTADAIAAGAVDTAELANDAVTADKIADNAVGNDQLIASPTFTNITGTLQTVAQPNITSVGSLTGLDVDGLVKVNDGSAAAPTFTFDSDEGNGMYLSEADTVSVATAGSLHLQIGGSVTPNDVITRATGTFKSVDSGSQFPTGSGTAAHIITGFGLSAVVKNSSVAADKENVSTDLGSHLTAGMIDSVVPKMWNRITAPGYPEIGPIADDMETISEFLASHGTDANGDQILTGVDTTAWMSLMTLALQDVRARLAALEG